jgi:two-component system sensor kinase FixL
VLGHFAGSLSHELRNPLAAIDSSAYYLGMNPDALDEKTREHLGRIRNNIKKSADIIESLLRLSALSRKFGDVFSSCHF